MEGDERLQGLYAKSLEAFIEAHTGQLPDKAHIRTDGSVRVLPCSPNLDCALWQMLEGAQLCLSATMVIVVAGPSSMLLLGPRRGCRGCRAVGSFRLTWLDGS